jgi:hypothetical protein
MSPLEFVKRAKRVDTDTAKRWRWRSLCDRYWVEKTVSLFGLPTVFYAIYVEPGGGQDILSNKCRTKDGAINKCQSHAKAAEQSPCRRRNDK